MCGKPPRGWRKNGSAWLDANTGAPVCSISQVRASRLARAVQHSRPVPATTHGFPANVSPPSSVAYHSTLWPACACSSTGSTPFWRSAAQIGAYTVRRIVSAVVGSGITVVPRWRRHHAVRQSSPPVTPPATQPRSLIGKLHRLADRQVALSPRRAAIDGLPQPAAAEVAARTLFDGQPAGLRIYHRQRHPPDPASYWPPGTPTPAFAMCGPHPASPPA